MDFPLTSLDAYSTDCPASELTTASRDWRRNKIASKVRGAVFLKRPPPNSVTKKLKARQRQGWTYGDHEQVAVPRFRAPL